MAPELIKRATTDQRIDVFSFGVSVYEVLTGSSPWEEAEESMQAMLQHVNQAGRDPREFNPNLDQETAEIILKGIERNPKDRYSTMKEFAEALRSLEPKKVPDEPKRKLVETSEYSMEAPKSKPAKKVVKRPGHPPSKD
jgi:serine/threonine protein kinase